MALHPKFPPSPYRTGCNEIATVHFMRPWGALGVCENHAIEEHGERLK